jgi:aldehyde:ferredoxin oxidoreductase
MGNLYAGTILRVDLTNRKITKEPTSPYAHQFVGGRGIDIRILYNEVWGRMSIIDTKLFMLLHSQPSIVFLGISYR